MTKPVGVPPPSPLRLAGVSSDSDGCCLSELPRPLLVTREMVDLIEGWAANAANFGELKAWEVLMATSLWRNDERGR